MGSVRRVLPRLLVLAGSAAAVALVFAGQQAHAQQQDPGLGGLVDQVGGVLPTDPVETLTAPLEPVTSSLTPPPAPAADPVQTLTAPLEPAAVAAGRLLDPAPVVGTRSDAAGGTVGTAPSLVTPVNETAAPVTNTVTATLGHPSTAWSRGGPSLPGLGALVDPLVPGVSPLAAPELTGPSLLSSLPDVDSVALPGIGRLGPPPGLALPNVVPELLARPGDLPLPALPSSPVPHPSVPLPFHPATTVLDGPTATGSALTTDLQGSLERVVGDTFSGPSTGDTTTAGEAFLVDPIAGPGPARGPPGDAPRDPPHGGSTHDARSVQYSTLPGTDQLGVTRGESWLPGTVVELTNPQPEPSVSPD